MDKISGIRLPVGYSEEDLKRAVLKKLNTYKDNLKSVKIIHRSIDARYKNNVLYVLTVVVEVKSQKGIRADEYVSPPRSIRELGYKPINSSKNVVVVGSGPAGLFAALTLAELGFKPTIIERGGSVDERVQKIETLRQLGMLDTETNVQFGEGGAGTFSDGKLNTGISKEYTAVVFGELVKAGAPEDIEYESNPHVGTDELRKVVKNVRVRLEELGAELKTHAKLTDITVKEGRIAEIEINGCNRIPVDYLVVAIGQSAEDTITMLNKKGVIMSPKPFSIGVRIEHKQEFISKAQYGESWTKLPPADYKLNTHLSNGRGVYTFCMCPGGEVVCSSCEEGTIITNGMSNRARDSEYANSAVLVSVNPQDFNCSLFGGFE
ncbi:MAG: FAD-binding protein, partial [Clostridia bacterium]|nr:FAD-binding protein [Clostridia bacterium]